MFPQSSQKKYWTYKTVNDLNALRIRQNQQYIMRFGGQNMNVSKNIFN